jgi:hypothetical protein
MGLITGGGIVDACPVARSGVLADKGVILAAEFAVLTLPLRLLGSPPLATVPDDTLPCLTVGASTLYPIS